MIDDEALVRQLFQTNPEQGCSWLFRRYHAPLCNHALRFVYTREVAEDIVGEVFCNFWTERAFERITTSYRAYLFKAVRNRAYNYLRWEFARRGDELDTAGSFPDGASAALKDTDPTSPADALQFDELYATINQTIADLPPQCRRVFLMSRFEQKPYRDIADELGISVKAVEANVSRALTTLRRVLKNGFLAFLFFLSMY
ncbi:RNA polymerase subunit sigma-24 [Spirosoma montaniterrae]|uniref:RNA polymerase subunit sigma-24 n=2 Tax=Spirosoma montaniterrae TaxID=1178516 RepID=A0A1P9X4N7_9BACT|nr:RNA polymerase subunit sigma-24 [Spirosoma montaniterrae]